jgi:hypothetical protein
MTKLSSTEEQTRYGIFNTIEFKWYVCRSPSGKDLEYTSNISEAFMFKTEDKAKLYSQNILFPIDSNLRFRLRVLPIYMQILYR